jgi:hypothetical protein
MLEFIELPLKIEDLEVPSDYRKKPIKILTISVSIIKILTIFLRTVVKSHNLF